MDTPLNPIVAKIVSKLDASQWEAFEERAGIMEFDGKLPRAHAECLALLDILHGGTVASPSGVSKYFCKLHERNGEFEYSHPVVFETDADPMLTLRDMAREFYPDEADAQDEGYYFFCGAVCITPESVVEITVQEYAVLSRFL